MEEDRYMSELGFEPLTSQLGIAGTSYRLQLGLINGKWACRLLKGKQVIDCYIFKDTSIEELPNTNQIINWVLASVPFPLNPHQIWRTTHILMRQAIENKEKKKERVSYSAMTKM